MKHELVIAALKAASTPEKAKSSAWFFKTGPGQYGEGDVFIGVTVPEQRKIAKQFKDLPLEEVKKLLQSPVHEHRLTALLILVGQYKHADDATKKNVAQFYYDNRSRVNNWDLVDSSAPYIYGDYVRKHGSLKQLEALAKAVSIWDRRIAVVATFAFLRADECAPTAEIAELLLHDTHDLLHKAVGWALREMGKVDEAVLVKFLDAHARIMPRTMLRYSVERLTPSQRRHYMSLRAQSLMA